MVASAEYVVTIGFYLNRGRMNTVDNMGKVPSSKSE